jgi:hypothetical protein
VRDFLLEQDPGASCLGALALAPGYLISRLRRCTRLPFGAHWIGLRLHFKVESTIVEKTSLVLCSWYFVSSNSTSQVQSAKRKAQSSKFKVQSSKNQVQSFRFISSANSAFLGLGGLFFPIARYNEECL